MHHNAIVGWFFLAFSNPPSVEVTKSVISTVGAACGPGVAAVGLALLGAMSGGQQPTLGSLFGI